MEDFLTLLDNNTYFATLLVVVLCISLLEGIMSVIGFGLSNLIDTVFPDIDLDIDSIDNSSTNSFTELFGWVNKGKTPVVMFIIIALLTIGLTGLFIQHTMLLITGSQLPSIIIIPLGTFLGFILTRYVSDFIGKIMPKEETEAVSRDSFIGNIGIVVSNSIHKDLPGEIKVQDIYEKTHYFNAFTNGEEILSQNEKVLLVGLNDSRTKFEIIKDPNQNIG